MNLKCSDHPSGRIFPVRLMMEKMMPASSLPSHLLIVLQRTEDINDREEGQWGCWWGGKQAEAVSEY